MITALKEIGYNEYESLTDKMIKTLSGYDIIVTDNNGIATYQHIDNNYFSINDSWNLNFLGSIPNFSEQYSKHRSQNKNIYFRFKNPNLNLEAKYVCHSNIFNTTWGLSNLFGEISNRLLQLNKFIQHSYPNLKSFLELDIEKAELQYTDWLESNNIKTTRVEYDIKRQKNYTKRTKEILFLSVFYRALFNLVDTREEWGKDVWDVRNLTKYGIEYNKTRCEYSINFIDIKNPYFRKTAKEYCKDRLIANNHFSWARAISAIRYLIDFLNIISDIEPYWKNLRQLKREHIKKYLELLKVKMAGKSNHYVYEIISSVDVFLSYIQMHEYDSAPSTIISKLILTEDKPKPKKRNRSDTIEYIPDSILEQLMKKFNSLHPEIQPIVLIMLYTGLRISDTLSLQTNCLIKLNGKYWVETDIMKVAVELHHIPIDDKIANVLAVLIDKSNKFSNNLDNPERYLFYRTKGSRKGLPYSQGWVLEKLKEFAINYKILDELGNIYEFKNHAFRHTYAVRMLNSGVDIIVLQDILAHASPEMTLAYAKILDNTKRKAFDNAVREGVFSFTSDNELEESNNLVEVEQILDMLWTNHKLDAIDTPYGLCLQRVNGGCKFAQQPPCLTCNSGKPCKDLFISSADKPKYDIHIQSAISWIEQGKKHNRDEWVTSNTQLLNLYENIVSKISQGQVVYERKSRLVQKDGDKN